MRFLIVLFFRQAVIAIVALILAVAILLAVVNPAHGATRRWRWRCHREMATYVVTYGGGGSVTYDLPYRLCTWVRYRH